MACSLISISLNFAITHNMPSPITAQRCHDPMKWTASGHVLIDNGIKFILFKFI